LFITETAESLFNTFKFNSFWFIFGKEDMVKKIKR
jgi:hypothetical protein